MPDKRVKGCPNPNCKAYKKVRYKAEEAFCSMCGQELQFVCSKCWTPLSVDDVKVRICDKCKAKAEDRAERAKKTVEKAVGAIGSVAMLVVSVINIPKKK